MAAKEFFHVLFALAISTLTPSFVKTDYIGHDNVAGFRCGNVTSMAQGDTVSANQTGKVNLTFNFVNVNGTRY